MRYAIGAAAAAVALMTVCACGASDSGDSSGASEGAGEGASEPTAIVSPAPAEPDVQPPDTKVVTCEVEDGLPVAEVMVDNTTGQAGAFAVEVQFVSGETVLGTGLEYTQDLKPGQNQTIRMGNMQGEAGAVDTCEVVNVEPLEE